MPKKIKVMGFGTFDGIHPGHLDFFRQLRELGDKVYVVVARDQTVERIKCKPPKRKERDRFRIIRESKLIDQVLMGHKDNFYQCIIDHQPDVIGLGYDQKADIASLKQHFPHIEIVRLKPFKPEQYKSSLLK